METWLVTVIATICTIMSSIVTWFLGRWKNKQEKTIALSETVKTSTTNLMDTVDMIMNRNRELTQELEVALEKNLKLSIEHKELIQEIEELKRQIVLLKNQIQKLTNKMS